MVPGNLLRMPRVSAGLLVVLLAITCVASAQAPAAAATTQTVYGFCIGRTPTQTIYISNVFSLPASARAGVRPAFLQYAKSQDSTVATANCIQATTQQQADNAKQSMEKTLQQAVQRSAATAHPLKLVETSWQYQAPATPVTQTATRTVTTTTTRRAIPVTTPTAATRTATAKSTATPTANSTSATAASTATPATGVNSIGQTVSATGQNAKQSVTQSVQGIESSTTTTVTDTITSTSTAGQTAIQNKIKGWQDKMFHKSKPAATTPASSSAPANTATASTAAAPSATLVSASATPAAKPTIQDEGDGKTFVLTEPGQTDSVEVTLVPGSKNAYLDAATGTKYIVMPDGSVKKIAHHK